ncbi:MAG: hybrid sensor histidine kinase/response regulator [Chloroflexi bacterium]|nr:hybrid sensor histidine kinase/response regulator [Chloroflexota bacterium]
MAEQDPERQELLAVFSAEIEERVRTLNQLALGLERGEGDAGARAEVFEALFREAHSLKGAARAVELDDIERLAHALESTLDQARTRDLQPPQAWFDAVFRGMDTFSALHRSALEGDGSPPPEWTDILAGLEGTQAEPTAPREATALATRPEHLPSLALAPATPAAPPAPMPVHGLATAASAPAVRGEAGGRAALESVRVAVSKLDALLAQAGELAVTDIRIKQRLRELLELDQGLDNWCREWRSARGLRTNLLRAVEQADGLGGSLVRELQAYLELAERAEQRALAVVQQVGEIATQLRQDTAQLGLVTQAIEEEVMAVRMLPVSTVFGPFERMVRDLSHGQAKEVCLVLEGTETEIDRKILEQLRDPLMHMLRNAVDHGIESPDERQARGKPRTGTIRLAAAQRGGAIELELEDDGGGLDPSRLRQSAVRKGLLSEDQAAALDDRSAMELIYHPGFSTRTTVTETSGRGVGMDVVRENVERLNGHIAIRSVLGRGTQFTLSLPLTLATARALLVEQSGQLFAIPSSLVERSARVQERQLVSLEGCRAVQIGEHPVPIVELADVLEQPRGSPTSQGSPGWRPFLVLAHGDRRVALLADRLMVEQEIVIKRLSWPLRRVRNVSGAAVLGSGQTVVILNPVDMVKTAWKLIGTGARRVSAEVVAATPERRRPRLLVVDDSLTTRTLIRTILDAAGYDTAVAADGAEALSMVRAAPVDLIVSDVDMPRMDGFALTAEIRRDEKLRQTPVVLVTSLETREHRERGVAVGADAYVVKSGFDQAQLLATIGRLL